MKNLKKLILLTFIVLTGFACSSDDDSTSESEITAQNQAKIIGTWQFASSTTNGVADTDNWICDLEETLVISASTVMVTYFNDPSGTNGNDCQLDGTFTFNYTISGNTLTDGEGGFVEIITLNGTTLTTKDVDGDDTYTETYTKQ